MDPISDMTDRAAVTIRHDGGRGSFVARVGLYLAK
jgi:hypothetical protein